MNSVESCSYCGLPLATGWWPWGRFGRSAAGQHQTILSQDLNQRPSYCCSGCRFAAEVAAESHAGSPINKPLARLGIAVFLTVNVVMFTMVLWSNDIYSAPGAAGHLLGAKFDDALRWLTLVLSAPVLWLLVGPLAANAWQEIRRGIAAVDLLLVLGVAAAFFYSLVSVVRGQGHVYFEVACVVLVLVTLGRWFESVGKSRSTASIDSLARLLPAAARKLTDCGEQMVSLADLRHGDRIRVLPGEQVAADGRVVSGISSVDEQSITGESRPVVKHVGQSVFGGTLNLDGQICVVVDSDQGHSAVQRLLAAMQEARRAKGHYQRLADRLVSWFLPLAVAIAAVATVWHAQQSGWEAGVLSGLSVLLIACPCALGLATPMSVWIALGRAAQHQVLFRHGDALEQLAAVDTMFFDKTGTLSSGQCEVVRFEIDDGESPDTVLQFARSLAATSNHPVSKAVLEFAARWQIAAPVELLWTHDLAGLGVSGIAPNRETVWLGNRRLMNEAKLSVSPELETKIAEIRPDDVSCTFVGWDGNVRGAFITTEDLRPESLPAIGQLQALGIHVEALSGDSHVRAAEMSKRLEIPVHGGLLPEEKLTVVRAAVHSSRGKVAMVGDGINDAPALATADIGIALGCGTDVSREAAVVCLLGNDLSRIPWALQLARQTVRVIRQNLFWSFAYNAIGIGLAVTGRLNPIWAAAAMMLSSFFVVGNSLRLGTATNLSLAQSENRPVSRRSETQIESAECAIDSGAKPESVLA